MINTPLSRDADAERAARSGGNLTSSGAGGNRPTRNVLCPSCRARTSTREMKGAGPIARAFRRSIIPRLAQGGFPLRINSITGSLAFVGESWDRCAVPWACRLARAGAGGEGVAHMWIGYADMGSVIGCKQFSCSGDAVWRLIMGCRRMLGVEDRAAIMTGVDAGLWACLIVCVSVFCLKGLMHDE